MTEGQIVLVLDGATLRVGRVHAYKPARPLRVQVHAFENEISVVRVEVRDVACVFRRVAADLDAAEAWVRSLADGVDLAQVEAVWAQLEGQPVGVGEVARRLLGTEDDASRDLATIAAVLVHDGFGLEGGRLLRRTATEREGARTERERQATWDAEVHQWRRQLHDQRAGLRVSWDGVAQRLAAVVAGADDAAIVYWLGQDGRHKKSATLDAAELLRELGVWDQHEDIDLQRSGLLTPWTPEAEGSLRMDAEVPSDMAFLDLPLVAMDNDAPHEVDDAICALEVPGGTRLYVAVAHPAAWLIPGSPADREAGRRGSTLYHPRHVVGMLPDALARGAASLAVGEHRPALVVSVTIDAHGQARDPAVQEAWVTVRHAWSYNHVEAVLAGAPMAAEHRAHLDRLIDVGLRAERARIAAGGWLLYRPDVEMHAPPFGQVQILSVLQTSPGRRLITEAMVQAGAAVGQLGLQHHLPLPYRVQPHPSHPPLPPGLYDDPASCFDMFRTMGPAGVQVTPAPHGVMGLPAYVQVTSPLRRYTDILAHRQLVAWLRGLPFPHSPAELGELAQRADEASRQRRHWQRRGAYYWKLVWLAGQEPGMRLQAQVVRNLGAVDRLVFVTTLSLEATVHAPHLHPGDHVHLTLRSVNPQRGQVEWGVT